MTLGINQFAFVSDLLLLTLVLMGAGALFLFLSAPTSWCRFSMVMAGIVLGVGCFYYNAMFHSWNEAFELAGNSYAASGHFFKTTYRYSDWLIAAPMMLVALSAALHLTHTSSDGIISRAIVAAAAFFFFGYLKGLALGYPFVSGVLFLGMVGAFVTSGFLFYKKIPLLLASHDAELCTLFLRARDVLFISWLLNVVMLLIQFLPALQGPSGLVLTTTVHTLVDLIAQGGVAFCIYRIASRKSSAATL